MSVVAVILSAVAVVFAGLSWWASRRSAGAAETSARLSVVSADAAQRSASVAEENLEYARADREAARVAARTPRFQIGPIDWRAKRLAESAMIYMLSEEPRVERVEVSVVGATDVGKYGSGIVGAPSLTWERPAPAEPYVITFSRDEPSMPVTIRLDVTLTADDDGAVRELALDAHEGATSSPR